MAFSSGVSIFPLLSSDFEVLYDKVEPWQAHCAHQTLFAILLSSLLTKLITFLISLLDLQSFAK